MVVPVVSRMIALALEECGRLDIRDALMCCGKDNAAPARTIIKNGGGRRNRPTMLGSSISKRSFHDERSFFPCLELAQSVRTKSPFHIHFRSRPCEVNPAARRAFTGWQNAPLFYAVTTRTIRPNEISIPYPSPPRPCEVSPAARRAFTR